MRCLREIQNIINRLLYRDRIKNNIERYEKMYTVMEYNGVFLSLGYWHDFHAFNYRTKYIYQPFIFRINRLIMTSTTYEIPKNY